MLGSVSAATTIMAHSLEYVLHYPVLGFGVRRLELSEFRHPIPVYQAQHIKG